MMDTEKYIYISLSDTHKNDAFFALWTGFEEVTHDIDKAKKWVLPLSDKYLGNDVSIRLEKTDILFERADCREFQDNQVLPNTRQVRKVIGVTLKDLTRKKPSNCPRRQDLDNILLPF